MPNLPSENDQNRTENGRTPFEIPTVDTIDAFDLPSFDFPASASEDPSEITDISARDAGVEPLSRPPKGAKSEQPTPDRTASDRARSGIGENLRTLRRNLAENLKKLNRNYTEGLDDLPDPPPRTAKRPKAENSDFAPEPLGESTDFYAEFFSSKTGTADLNQTEIPAKTEPESAPSPDLNESESPTPKPTEKPQKRAEPPRRFPTQSATPPSATEPRGDWRKNGIWQYLLRPASLYDAVPERISALSLLCTALFFTAFYLTVALDWLNAGLTEPSRVIFFCAIGFLTGGCAAMIFAAGCVFLAKKSDRDPHRPFRFLAPLAGTEVFPFAMLLLAILIGLIFSVPVSMTLGVTALLWWLCTVTETLRDLFGKEFARNLTFLILYAFAIFAWMTFTFRLK